MVKWTDMLDYGKRKYFKTLHSIELPYNRTEESRNVGRAIILYIPEDQDPTQKYNDTYTGKINNTSVTFENPNGVVPYLKASFDTTDVNVNLSSLTAITKITTLNIESNIHKTSIATAPSVTLKPGSGANVTSDGSFRFIHSSPSVKNTYAYTVSAVKQGQGAPVGPGNGGQFKLSADGLSAGSTTDWGASYDIYIKLDDNQTKVSEAPAGDYISYITVTEDSI